VLLVAIYVLCFAGCSSHVFFVGQGAFVNVQHVYVHETCIFVREDMCDMKCDRTLFTRH